MLVGYYVCVGFVASKTKGYCSLFFFSLCVCIIEFNSCQHITHGPLSVKRAGLLSFGIVKKLGMEIWQNVNEED